MNRECESCVKRKTTYCPCSFECMATDDKPYYQNRRMLSEENNQLKEIIQKVSNKVKVVKEFNFDKVGRYEILKLLGDEDE